MRAIGDSGNAPGNLLQRPATAGDRPANGEARILNKQREDRDLQEIFDLLAEDSRLNVYAGKLEVRPTGAPTTPARIETNAAAGKLLASARDSLLGSPGGGQ